MNRLLIFLLIASLLQDPQLTETNPVTGDLTKKNCTTTFSNMQPRHSNVYNFRLECNNDLKYTYDNLRVNIDVIDNFPSPTLTPSTLRVKEGDSVSLTCSAPAPCVPHPPTLIWTHTLGHTQETLQEDWDKTLVKTSVLSFTASHLHHRQTISCSAVYKKQDGSSDASLTTSVMPDVLFPSKILPSSNCTKTTSQVNCSCETMGNPSPTTLWHLNGRPVNQSSQVVVTNESLNSSYLRSIITVNEPHGRDLSTLLCFSYNSWGSASKRFCVSCLESSREDQGQIPKSVFIATVTALLLIVCALLFVVWFQKTHYKPTTITGDSGTVAPRQHLMKEINEVPNPNEDAIYANSAELGHVVNPQPSNPNEVNCTSYMTTDNAGETSKSLEKKDEDVVYTSVNWSKKRKSKKGENDVNMNPSGDSYLEEEKFERGGMLFVNSAMEMGSLYAEVKIRPGRKEIIE
ncbi:sialic acid-binding Ig-like lectin 9 [Fundulus heteroclitus]|uniref:sialic acid-binding Ig-like lectin 9 n=1 Tax=Fundulus heteroclitus TaxID=8078 RepID=UPI00165CC6D5|nr:sialic acid-binding Ig-like lectin 9 [Fundulus heteroclitus]